MIWSRRPFFFVVLVGFYSASALAEAEEPQGLQAEFSLGISFFSDADKDRLPQNKTHGFLRGDLTLIPKISEGLTKSALSLVLDLPLQRQQHQNLRASTFPLDFVGIKWTYLGCSLWQPYIMIGEGLRPPIHIGLRVPVAKSASLFMETDLKRTGNIAVGFGYRF